MEIEIPNEELLSTTELSKLLKVSHQSIYKWRGDGMPHMQLGEKTFRYKFSEVIAWRSDRMKNKPEFRKG